MNKFPKVLIISVEPFNRNNGTGITLSNLFDGWDRNSIAQIYMSPMERENTICSNYYQLSPKIAYLDYYCRSFFSSLFKKINVEKTNSPAAVTLERKHSTYKAQFHLNVRAIADLSPIHLPAQLFEWINEFKPDLVYCALGNARMLNITIKISKIINKPIVPHFMDDWPSTLYTQMELFGLARNKLIKRINIMLKCSNGGLCISDLMADEYKIRYNLPFSPFVNCVEDKKFDSPHLNGDSYNFTIMYIGGLHLNRWKSLLDISMAIEKINAPIYFKIYCPTHDNVLYAKHFKDNRLTTFEGSIDNSEVFKTLKKASLLVHVESFDMNFAQYTRLSLSTKIPQYMAAGKPIMGYGPKGLASMLHIELASAGKIVCTPDSKYLCEVLEELVTNKTMLHKYAKNGFDYAKKYHLRSTNHINLINILNKLKNDK
ncbi:hypothetical protein [Pedobacter sp. CG_S7]|uniref:hypothetical protein n=1 Tax=Pedobacter sp. CG_S7 TaxID=3143930 RepID=UPI00339301C7